MHSDDRSFARAMTRRRALQLLAGAAGALSSGVGFAMAQTPPASNSPAPSVDWDKLRRDLRGTLITRDDAAYEARRTGLVWNARQPRRLPAAIVQVASEDDVRNAVRFAGKNGLKVAIRGGGHNWNATSLRQDALVLDLSRLQEVSLDVERRQLAIQPAHTAREVVELLTPHGLAFPVGHCPSVPMSGYLLNGGFGWNSGVWGPACVSVRAVELIDAGGTRVEASADRNREYYWAARGAGSGFFGVVTRYHLQVHALPSAIRTTTITFRGRDTDAVAKWLAPIAAQLPPEVEVVCAIASPPPGLATGGGAPVRKVLIVAATAFANDEAEAQRWLKPLATPPRGVTPLERTLAQPSTFETLHRTMDGFFPSKQRYAADAAWSNAPLTTLLPMLRDQAIAATSSRSFVLIALAPPAAPNAVPPPDMALSMFGQAYVAVYGVWGDPAQDAAERKWVRTACAAIAPHTVGHYIGESDLGVDAERAQRCFTPTAWTRLQALKERFDPDDRFCSYAVEAS